MLGAREIMRRIRRGELVVVPFLDEMERAALALRIGREVVIQSRTGGEYSRSLALGEVFELRPLETSLVATLETVQLPADLSGLVAGAIEDRGLAVVQLVGEIQPGFGGKLLLQILNLGDSTVQLHSGMRLASLLLFRAGEEQARMSVRKPGATRGSGGDVPQAESDDVSSLRRVLDDISRTNAVPLGDNATDFYESWRKGGNTPAEKGMLLERLITEFVKSVPGLKIVKNNPRLASEELDLLVRNEVKDGSWPWLGSHILIECKNWSQKVGAQRLSAVFDALQAISPDAKTAILVAPKGVTGSGMRDARLKIREWRQRGRYVLLIEEDQIHEVGQGLASFAEKVEESYERLYLI